RDTGDAAPYEPVFQALTELLFGDHAHAFRKLQDAGVWQSLCRTAANGETPISVECDASRPVNEALSVLCADQPGHYVDREGRPLDALAVLTAWQQHLRALTSPVTVAAAHAA